MLNNHVEANALGNKHQSAYKAGHSNETVLLSIQNDVRLALSKGEATLQSFSTYQPLPTPSTMTLCLIGYYHGLVYVDELSHGSGCILLITFNALRLVMSNAQKLIQRTTGFGS